ncbi:E3 ubiquitin-protein ligase RNF169 [Melanotaenia boesemani]|uniref:E3 ubiquitin-protein ligase RNF169 n=1 Tax=Melanotaenia boesemani TaxID=1250792 RepID=UPI001C0563F0|nr:E3 ubiquitin-protein ligase RNF169 [Melanotaenia boesemani]
MATAGSAEHPVSSAGAAADTSRCRSRSRCRSGPSQQESDGKKCTACVDSHPSGSSAYGHPACPLCLARRHSGREERLWGRSDPEKGSSKAGRRDGDSRRELFVCPALIPKSADVLSGLTGKHKLLSEDQNDVRKRSLTGSAHCDEEPGVLSDSENEKPISRRIRTISAFIRKTKNSSAFSSGCQRSRSCTDPMEDRGGKLKVLVQPAAMLERVGISHSSAAGILLSSENSRSVSAPITAPDRRLSWRVVLTSSTPPGLAPVQPERSISPESNDSISEELNHFKPIVCSPCTPPKRLPDGRLLEPTIVKSTPRNLTQNLTRGLQKATSYEASPAVLQKWRQIELDRQKLKVNSKGTLTSPVPEPHGRTNGGEDGPGGAGKRRAGNGVTSSNKRRLLFDTPAAEPDLFQKQSVKIRVPAIHYSSAMTPQGGSDSEPAGATPDPCSGAIRFSRTRSFKPYDKDSGFQSCKFVPKDQQCLKKDGDGIHNQSTSRRGKKKKQKTKHLDPDLKRTRPVIQEQQFICQIQQDRALALKLQRQFDLERTRTSPDKYFLRSWMSTQNRRRRGLRRSRRINKKH